MAALGAAASMSGLDGRSHSVGIATDGHNVAVGVDGGASHVLHQKQAAEQKHNQLLEGAQVPAPLKKLKSTYGLAVEGMPERIRLAREIRGLFKPVACYHPKYHKFRLDPLTQISNAYNRKVDSAEYWRNRTYYSRLYQSLCDAKVAQGDIQTIWGSPYISAAINWDKLPNNRQQAIRSQHPEIDGVAKGIACARSDFATVLSKTAPETHRFVNEFAIPMTALASTSSASERLKQVADKVASCMYEVADTFNRLMVPGYAAYADGGSVKEVVTSAGSDLVLTYFGAKVIKLSYQGAKYVGGKLVSTLTPKTQTVSVKLPWTTWKEYPKITLNGTEYAKIGERLYTKHAVNYMRPSGWGALAGEMFNKEGVPIPGRSLAPGFVEEVIKHGKFRETVMPNGVKRRIYSTGTSEIVTEQEGKIVITINPFRGVK